MGEEARRVTASCLRTWQWFSVCVCVLLTCCWLVLRTITFLWNMFPLITPVADTCKMFHLFWEQQWKKEPFEYDFFLSFYFLLSRNQKSNRHHEGLWKGASAPTIIVIFHHNDHYPECQLTLPASTYIFTLMVSPGWFWSPSCFAKCTPVKLPVLGLASNVSCKVPCDDNPTIFFNIIIGKIVQ